MSSISFRCKYLQEESKYDYMNETSIILVHPLEWHVGFSTKSVTAAPKLPDNATITSVRAVQSRFLSNVTSIQHQVTHSFVPMCMWKKLLFKTTFQLKRAWIGKDVVLHTYNCSRTLRPLNAFSCIRLSLLLNKYLERKSTTWLCLCKNLCMGY